MHGRFCYAYFATRLTDPHSHLQIDVEARDGDPDLFVTRLERVPFPTQVENSVKSAGMPYMHMHACRWSTAEVMRTCMRTCIQVEYSWKSAGMGADTIEIMPGDDEYGVVRLTLCRHVLPCVCMHACMRACTYPQLLRPRWT